jgi:CheY-like chemotaxis protein
VTSVAARAVHLALPAPVNAQGLPTVARAKILLVEDDPRVREVTAEWLREAGFVVAAAADGMQAMALLRRGEPVDVMFTDVVMPGGMSGVDLVREARRLWPALPVLLATGYPGQGLDSEQYGFEVLAKPYDQALLVRRMVELTVKIEMVVA